MKNIRHLWAAILLGAMLPHTQTIADESEGYEWGVSANVGFLSQYIYRGIKQSDTAAMGGIDVEYGPVYIGTWIADLSSEKRGEIRDTDDDVLRESSEGGIEYDLYAGLSYSLGEVATVGVGYTTYQYSDGWDAEYNETNLSLGLASEDFPVSLDIEYSFGKYNDDGDGDGSDDDYTFTAATLGYEGLYLTAGSFGDDFDGDYVEVGYGTTVMETIDVGLGLVDSDGDLDDDTRIYFSIATTFDLF